MNAVESFIALLGGIRPACAKIEAATGVKVWPASVQHWIAEGRIPIGRRQQIIDTAKAEKIESDDAWFFEPPDTRPCDTQPPSTTDSKASAAQ